MFEFHQDPVIARRRFLMRLVGSALVALGLAVFSLGIGVLGYHYIAKLSWIDAFLNAAMIMSGMGPVDEIHGTGAKLFAGCYALYSGLVILSTAAILLAPLVHRLLHHFHRASPDAGQPSRN